MDWFLYDKSICHERVKFEQLLAQSFLSFELSMVKRSIYFEQSTHTMMTFKMIFCRLKFSMKFLKATLTDFVLRSSQILLKILL